MNRIGFRRASSLADRGDMIEIYTETDHGILL
jgi:hypothetical protein